MKTFQRVGALILVMAMLLPFGAEFASAEWNSTVGYYGSVTMEMLEEKLVHENKQVDVHFLEIAYDEDMGAYRLRYMDTGAWYLNTEGTFPYVLAAGDVPATDIAVENTHSNQWLGLTERSKTVETVTQDALATAVIALNDAGIDCSLVKGYYNEILYYFICTPDYKYYCNSKGEMFVAPAEASATDLNRPHYNDDGDTMETPVIDRDNQTLNLPMSDGTVVNLTIDNMTYDDGDKSYTVNAYTTINEGDTYNYVYYTYNIQYNITNTYITYIGANEPYEREEYELYYQLPDGRSSADLTAEEVAGMSFEFYDVVNYERSTDDISVQALYHFDGTIEDSSYFSGLTDGFKWVTNASITYMDAGEPFGGALYLDERAHEFTIDLPEDIMTNNFTLTFRYYQASEPDTLSNVENGVYIGSQPLMTWDEQHTYNAAGTSLSNYMSVGTWNEVSIVRSYNSNKLRLYINGIRASNLSFNVDYLLDDKVTFKFGDTSRAYSMIDELRIVDRAMYSGTSCECTAVPYDSNLILVLPDAERPMADKYYEIQSSGTNLFGDAFNFIENGGSLSNFIADSTVQHSKGLDLSYNKVTYSSQIFNPIVGDRYVLFDNFDDENTSDFLYGTSNHTLLDTCGFVIPTLWSKGFKVGRTYTLSLVHVNGTIDSLTFTPSGLFEDERHPTKGFYAGLSDVATFSWGRLGFGHIVSEEGATSVSDYHTVTSGVFIIPDEGKSVDVAYIEVVEGSSSDIKLVGVTDVYDGADIQPNTAAIQTIIPVKGYTVGGVRPSMPSKGDLWFPVMENRITSVQIYTGSMWQEVNARWFTGTRWIPIYAFDITTLEDLFDIADADDVVTILPDQNSFLRWWQLQWLDFRSWLDGRLSELIAAVGGGGEGIDTEIPDDDGNVKFSPLQLIDTILGGLLEIAKEVIVEFVSLVVDLFKMFIQALLDFVGGLVDVLSSGLTHFSILSDGLSGIGNFVSGTYDAIPDDIQGVLTSSFVVIISVSLLAFLL